MDDVQAGTSHEPFRLDLIEIAANGAIAIAETSEDWTRIKILEPEGEPGVADREHELPFEALALIPDGDSEFVFIGARGQIARVGATVELRDEMPLRRGNEQLLHGAARIGGRVHVASLSGELLERRGDGSGWKTVCKPLTSSGEFVWAIGANDAEVFAVGSSVWQRRGGSWVPTDAPRGFYTALTFHEGAPVTFTEKSLARRTADGVWLDEPLDVRKKIDDLCSFQGTLHLAADGVLYTLAGDELRQDSSLEACSCLVSNGDVLLAATNRELHCSSGATWFRLW
ncbi:MAG: hypothetical protein Q8S33_30985 [Myxococcales bacterium]|nr:hypothetical protein [Myxococcales bacterium]